MNAAVFAGKRDVTLGTSCIRVNAAVFADKRDVTLGTSCIRVNAAVFADKRDVTLGTSCIRYLWTRETSPWVLRVLDICGQERRHPGYFVY